MENLVKDILDFYRGKRVFVTGHTGFKGSWLCRMPVSYTHLMASGPLSLLTRTKPGVGMPACLRASRI